MHQLFHIEIFIHHRSFELENIYLNSLGLSMIALNAVPNSAQLSRLMSIGCREIVICDCSDRIVWVFAFGS